MPCLCAISHRVLRWHFYLQIQKREDVAMSKPKRANTPEISVKLVFDGKHDSKQIFIGLMLDKARQNAESLNLGLEPQPNARYYNDKVFSDVRVGMKGEIA